MTVTTKDRLLIASMDRTMTGLMPACSLHYRIQIDKVNVPSFNSHQVVSSPSVSVTINSSSISQSSFWISGSFAIAANWDSVSVLLSI
jgi:hypothetical protein